MRQVERICRWTMLAAVLGGCHEAPNGSNANAGAVAATAAEPPMVLTEAIPLEGVKGRFDHFAYGRGHIFVSALGNNSVEIINVGARTLEHTIPNVPDPQGEAFSPEENKLFVASGRGKVHIFDGNSYNLITAADFEGGADNLRYESTTKRVYVGCGDDERTGAIAAIDAATNRRTDEEYKLGGEPESFQLEKSGPNIYVNIPELKQIAVIDRSTKAVTRWAITLEGNFPMALDERDHRLFVGSHEPPRLAVFDTTDGHMITAIPSVQGSDDLYYDATRKRVYMPGTEGAIDVFQQDDADHYRVIAKISSALGAGTAGYFGKQGKGFDRFFLAVPVSGTQSAEVRIYTVQD
jgi:DNA-binding beta-propeller fold protein YncE